jgi:osmotically-inducible protein OsmY
MQTAATEFAGVLKFRFDSGIMASDGEEGKLTQVIADSQQRTVTHLGIRVGLLFGKTCYLPIQYVSEATTNLVTVSASQDEILTYTSIPEGAPLTHSTGVMVAGKRIGHLTQLTFHRETLVLRHLVIEHGSREVLLPASVVTSITSRQISADLGGTSVARLTIYRPDEELRQAVYDAIYNYSRLRVELAGIAIHAIDGVVWLHGYVSNDLNRRMVEDQLWHIPGLAELHNELIADNELAANVSMALARDSRTATQHIGVYPKFGQVHLRGRALTAEARQDAGTIAATVPGVNSVVNELLIDPNAQVVPVLAGITNEEDQVPG